MKASGLLHNPMLFGQPHNIYKALD